MKAPEDKYMSMVKVGEKGQIVIPKAARDMFDIKPGDNLLLLADKEKGIAIVRKNEMMEIANKIFSAESNKEK